MDNFEEEIDNTHPDDIDENGNYNSLRNKDHKSFKNGDVIVWHSDNFFRNYWNNLPEEERIKYYGEFGYGQKGKKFFIFLNHIHIKDSDDGERWNTSHSTIVEVGTGKIHTMVHPTEFRFADDTEF